MPVCIGPTSFQLYVSSNHQSRARGSSQLPRSCRRQIWEPVHCTPQDHLSPCYIWSALQIEDVSSVILRSCQAPYRRCVNILIYSTRSSSTPADPAGLNRLAILSSKGHPVDPKCRRTAFRPCFDDDNHRFVRYGAQCNACMGGWCALPCSSGTTACQQPPSSRNGTVLRLEDVHNRQTDSIM